MGMCPHCLLAGGIVEPEPEVNDGSISQLDTQPLPSASVAKSAEPPIKRIGDYELVREIARGGMGIVYEARQTTLNRPVAVKTILSGAFAGKEEVTRFFAEARTAATLKHPNIVGVHEAGIEEGLHFFAMELIEGRNLGEVMKENPLSPSLAARTLKTVAETVEYAHRQGVIHRDLKPGNILIDAKGEPHLTDFGLAREFRTDRRLTQPGAVLGSPHYMSPEQVSGDRLRLGPAADIYSLGVVLYEMLTGALPISGESTMEMLSLIPTAPVQAPTRINASIPTDLETICLKCLEKKPELRYASAAELAEDLDRFLNHRSIKAKPPNPARSFVDWFQNNPWALTGIVSGVAMALFCLLFALWEQTRFLQSQMITDNAAPPLPFRLPLLHFFVTVPTLGFLLHYCADRFRHNLREANDTGKPPPAGAMWFNVGLGIAGMGYAFASLLIQIRAWVWYGSNEQLWLEIVGALCLAGLAWVGLLTIWEALASHRLSRFAGAVEKHVSKSSKRRLQGWQYSDIIGFTSLGCLLFIIQCGYLVMSLPYQWAIFLSGALALTLILLVSLETMARFKARPIRGVFLSCVSLNLAVYLAELLCYSEIKNTIWALLIIMTPAAFAFVAARRLQSRGGSVETGTCSGAALSEHRKKLVTAGLGGLLASLVAIISFLIGSNAVGERMWREFKADAPREFTQFTTPFNLNVNDNRRRQIHTDLVHELSEPIQPASGRGFDASELIALAAAWNDTNDPRGIQAPRERALALHSRSRGLFDDAVKALKNDEAVRAEKHILTLAKLARLAGMSNSLEGALAALKLQRFAFSAFAEGCRTGAWSTTQIRRMAAEFAKFKPLENLRVGLLNSRIVAVNRSFPLHQGDWIQSEYNRNHFLATPRGWRLWNLIRYNREFAEFVLPCLNAAPDETIETACARLDERRLRLAVDISPSAKLSRILPPLPVDIFASAAEARDSIALAAIGADWVGGEGTTATVDSRPPTSVWNGARCEIGTADSGAVTFRLGQSSLTWKRPSPSPERTQNGRGIVKVSPNCA